MAILFRGIGNKAWWDKSHDDFPWLGKSELVADVLKSLGTVDGTLSMYQIENPETQVSRVIAALASGKDTIQHFDYLLVPIDVVMDRFQSDDTLGKTPDSTVNNWHLDIVNLTPYRVSQLSYILHHNRLRLFRMPKLEVKSALQTSKDNGFIEMSRVSKRIAKALA